MANLIFVHGAFANKHSWFDVPDALRSDHSVTCETLSGATKPKRVPLPRLFARERLADYVAQVEGFLDDQDHNWLIGHSMGGMVISQVAANAPKRVSGLIYVAAVLPKDGKSTFEMSGMFNPLHVFPNHDKDEIRQGFANQPVRPLMETFALKPGFEDVPKHYFLCEQDKVIEPNLQADMAAGYPDVKLRKLASDHLPMHPSAKQPSALPDLLEGLKEIIPT